MGEEFIALPTHRGVTIDGPQPLAMAASPSFTPPPTPPHPLVPRVERRYGAEVRPISAPVPRTSYRSRTALNHATCFPDLLSL